MMIKWGRKGLFAGAFAFTFIAPSVTSNTVQAHHLTQGIHGDFQYRHLSAPSVGANTLTTYKYFDSVTRFDFRYITSVAEIAEETSAGGGRLRKPVSRILPPLESYEKRVKELLKKEKEERKREEIELKARLAVLKSDEIKTAKQQKTRQKQELELRLLAVTEALLQVQHELSVIDEKMQQIRQLAKILRDDDELMVILYG